MNKSNYPQALEYSYKAKATAEKHNNWIQRSYILLLMSNIYEKSNNIDSAYCYLSKYTDVRNHILSNSRTVDSYKAYISIYMESLQKELVIASQTKRIFIIISIFVTVTLLLSLTLLTVLQKRKQNMAQQIDRDKQIKILQEENIEFQQRELATHALLLSEKTELLQQIETHIKALPKDNADVKAINEIIKGNLTTDEWQNFIYHFNNVHPSFFDKLKAHAPELTENNLRLCAYLRISMNSKQIAQMLNMSPDNVRKSSYRLKKKLSLNEDDNLYDFLRNL